jgi:hypothetical protein
LHATAGSDAGKSLILAEIHSPHGKFGNFSLLKDFSQARTQQDREILKRLEASKVFFV